ncbi:NUDIX hydrolase [Hoeflea sp.]|uniref:NUDIX hydrolase n=1 Tax=Hoeflea sp. TaxID=1940281 RepID=UPI003BAEDCA5
MTPFDRLRQLLDLFRSPDGSKASRRARRFRQAAAAVFRDVGEERELLLITSRDTGRWIVPKGWIENGENGAEAALREAWEEAGVRGELASAAIAGEYRYVKQRARRGDVLCTVEVYSINLTDEEERWPEKGERTRKWFTIPEAIGLVDEPGLREVIRDAMQLSAVA